MLLAKKRDKSKQSPLYQFVLNQNEEIGEGRIQALFDENNAEKKSVRRRFFLFGFLSPFLVPAVLQTIMKKCLLLLEVLRRFKP
jgi:hypothetical protein